ncbi:lysoplasmalogenase [Burkholderia singularis]|uniref:POSSIBLE MEMBRANE PROTEIN n=1 Tax=Burkholderia singularis TaxID=1503053 RepID=A0A238H5A1_9BURK|nr:lysoplasmalogenase [Burkholderia singularis]SMG00203.1 POSSIBLE MEMBRANE PROTEIN [Burkholderia singularis]
MLSNLPVRTRGLWLAAAFAALLYGLSLGHTPYPGQPAAKAALGMLLLVAALRHPAARERGWLVAALGASVLGDVLLALPQWPLSFVAGLGAFLLAHLAYCALFAPWRAAPRGPRAVALAVLWVAAPGLYAAFFPHLAVLAAPVAFYIATLGVMASLALCARTPGPQIATGALAFVGSDAMIGIGRFLPAFAFAGIDDWIWFLYAAAQLAITFGVLRRRTSN